MNVVLHALSLTPQLHRTRKQRRFALLLARR
jgi:hypothetical protein